MRKVLLLSPCDQKVRGKTVLDISTRSFSAGCRSKSGTENKAFLLHIHVYYYGYYTAYSSNKQCIDCFTDLLSVDELVEDGEHTDHYSLNTVDQGKMVTSSSFMHIPVKNSNDYTRLAYTM